MSKGKAIEREVEDLWLRLAFSNSILQQLLFEHCRKASLVGDLGALFRLREFKSTLLKGLIDRSDPNGANAVMRDLAKTFFDQFGNGHDERDGVRVSVSKLS